jgi:hypothetical protein
MFKLFKTFVPRVAFYDSPLVIARRLADARGSNPSVIFEHLGG